MQNDKVRVIAPIGASAILIVINLLDALLVKRIPLKDIQDDIRLMLEPIKRTLQVLSDKDPNNEEQLKAVWVEFVRSEEFGKATEQRILQAIAQIPDEPSRTVISKLIVPCLATVRVLYDTNPDNAKQIRDIWVAFLSEKENLTAMLAFLIQDENVLNEITLAVDIIVTILKEAELLKK